ncbi:MAG: DUF1761 domain-containing protein [Stellaceae bacterium]
MQFVGINHWAVVAAGAAGWVLAALWYGLVAQRWLGGVRRRAWVFLIAVPASLITAEILAGLMGHVGISEFTWFHGALTGAFCWIGFVIMPLLVSNRYAGRAAKLILVDGGFWLVVLLVMGAILGGIGLD